MRIVKLYTYLLASMDAMERVTLRQLYLSIRILVPGWSMLDLRQGGCWYFKIRILPLTGLHKSSHIKFDFGFGGKHDTLAVIKLSTMPSEDLAQQLPVFNC